MGDDEARQEEAREDAAIERCLRNGTMIICGCGYVTVPYFTHWDDDRQEPMCQKCRDSTEEDADGEEE